MARDDYPLLAPTLLLASTLTVMAGATVAPALPAIQAAFAGTPGAALLTRLVLTMPALFIVLGAPLVGMVIDRWGRTRMLAAATGLYALAGVSGAVLDSLAAILVGRAVLGLAVAGILTTVTTLIADHFEGHQRARLLGLQGAFTSFGGVVYLVLGGLLADVSWRGPFYVYLASLLLLPMMLRGVPEPVRGEGIGGPALPPVPKGVFAIIYGTAFLTSVAFYVVPTQLPYYLERLVGAGGTESGMAIAVTTVFATVAAVLYGKVRARFGFRAITVVVFLGMGSGYAVVGAAAGWPGVIAGLAMVGLVMGLLLPNLNTWITDVASEARRGRAVGGLTTSIFLGQFASPLVSQPAIEGMGFARAFLGTGVALLVVALAAGTLWGVQGRLLAEA